MADWGLVWFGSIHYSAFFGSEGHVALDRNPGPGYNTLLLRMIPGDLLSVFPHRQFHTLPGLLDSWAALPNSYPNACMPMQGGSLYHFYDGLWYDPTERRTQDLLCKRQTRYRLSQPDTVDWGLTMPFIYLRALSLNLRDALSQMDNNAIWASSNVESDVW